MALRDLLGSIPLFPLLERASWSTIALSSSAAVLVILAAAYAYNFTYKEWTLSYYNLPGPPSDNWFLGNTRAVIRAAPLEHHLNWIKIYGPTYRYKMLGGMNRFFSADPVALSYVLSHSDMFPKPEMVRRQLSQTIGVGVLLAEGADHKRQRRLMNPSFSAAAVRDMVPIFFDKAYELKDKMLNMIEDETVPASKTPAQPEDKVAGGRKIDVMKYINQATLDVIGIAGFDYDFQALSQSRNELAEAFITMFSASANLSYFALVQALVPGTSWIPNERTRRIMRGRKAVDCIGKELIDAKKRVVSAAHAGGLEKGDDIGKDLLSILVKANMASDIPAEQKMTDEEVLGQITTFMLAGNETSATCLTWTLWALSNHPEHQEKLRKELQEVQNDRPSMDELAALPFLDAVIRESLRLLAPAPSTIRTAAEDVVIPLGTPVKGRDGQVMESVKVDKGAMIFIPILAVNQSPFIWGPDADQFNPDRFASPSEGSNPNQVPGVWGNLLSFLGGTRNCIGYRFALAEIKAILFVLVRNFKFEELASKPTIEKKTAVVMRPRVKEEAKEGFQLPLMVKPL